MAASQNSLRFAQRGGLGEIFSEREGARGQALQRLGLAQVQLYQHRRRLVSRVLHRLVQLCKLLGRKVRKGAVTISV
jgi:hypothetical protein